jgi:hypothetical protein
LGLPIWIIQGSRNNPWVRFTPIKSELEGKGSIEIQTC